MAGFVQTYVGVTMVTPKFTADVKEGQPIFHDRRTFGKWMEGLEGKRVTVVVEKLVKHRSTPQNAYYWGVCTKLISETSGYTPDEVHELLKQKFLRKSDPLSLAIDFRRTGSTTELTTTEFENYLDSVKQFAAEFFGITMPDPNEVV